MTPKLAYFIPATLFNVCQKQAMVSSKLMDMYWQGNVDFQIKREETQKRTDLVSHPRKVEDR